MVDTPSTFKGTLIAIAAALIVIIFLFTTNLIAFAVGALLIVLAVYLVYIVLARAHQRAMGRGPARRGGA